jgi:hypothetical protein
VDIGQRTVHVAAAVRGQVPDRAGRGQDQAHGRAQPFDPLIVGQRGHASAQLLVAVGQGRCLLE